MSAEEWREIMQGSRFMEVGPLIGLFCNGILRTSYQSHRETYTVNVHPGGQFRISTQIIVLDEETARRVCREIAGLSAAETPLPKWVADAFTESDQGGAS